MAVVDSALSLDRKRALLATMLESRLGDLREESLNRQGKGHFHVSGQGHEAMAVFGMLMEPDDYVCPYYRDRALVLGRGVTTSQLALDYMAKRASSSHGRQMPSHYSYSEFHIWSVPTPTASQLLPACGMAWGMKLDERRCLTIATVGDAATRQGDFFEAVAFARERQLPYLLVVEDNGYGISSPTRRTNPLALGVLAASEWVVVEGWNVDAVHEAAVRAMERIRSGAGPAFLWLKFERLSSHTSSDDQKIYRSGEELSTLSERDPLEFLKKSLMHDGALGAEEFVGLEREARDKVRAEYLTAEKAENPRPSDLEANVVNPMPDIDEEIFKPGTYRIGDMINLTLRAGLDSDPRRVIFGEDVEDPKGGVFSLTKNLSTDFPGQVFNSPLAESTILGVACGLASYGRRPVFELQFIDFIYPGWNQLVTNLATLRWRTFGRWSCPAVIYAPYGAYLPGGSLWHSQANEAAVAHFPGLNVVIPSTPEDAAGLLWTAMHGDDPTLVLIPKHLLWATREMRTAVTAVPMGQARRVTEGRDVTIVAWGNTVEKSLEALDQIGGSVSIELIDLRSISPWDRESVEESVRKTGRLIVVQEDTENCSVGQMVISHISGRADVWVRMHAPPVLVSKGNVMIGYSPVYEYAALPDVPHIVDAVHQTMSRTRAPVRAEPGRAAASAEPRRVAPPPSRPAQPASGRDEVLKMPMMGEGIREARIVALLKKPGDKVAEDEPICEVETDKAIYPVESSHTGILKEWRCHVGDAVQVGGELAIVSLVDSAPVAEPAGDSRPAVVAGLAPALWKRVAEVIPANIQMDARWEKIAAAREIARQSQPGFSPSLILGWCVTSALKKHPSFCRLVAPDGPTPVLEDFDLGVAVALERDRLGTAVIANAGRLDWREFSEAFTAGVAAVRAGKTGRLQAPLIITSLGAFGIELATPIVVPPAMSTLFMGTAHNRMVEDRGVIFPAEVVTLSLTFDHRAVNGAGAGEFLHEVRTRLENFELPGPPS